MLAVAWGQPGATPARAIPVCTSQFAQPGLMGQTEQSPRLLTLLAPDDTTPAGWKIDRPDPEPNLLIKKDATKEVRPG